MRKFYSILILLSFIFLIGCQTPEEILNKTYCFKEIMTIDDEYYFDYETVGALICRKLHYSFEKINDFSTLDIEFDNDNLIEIEGGFKALKPGNTKIYTRVEKNKKIYLADVLIAEEGYSNFTPIDEIVDLQLLATLSDKSGNYILRSDLDFSNSLAIIAWQLLI